jgi:uncharacterized protein YyaL (SSP411 family)
VDAIWALHIRDKETGLSNRHDRSGAGDFSFSSGSFVMAFAFMHSVTQEQHYLDKAKLVSDWHWNHVNPNTGLMSSAPSGLAKNSWNGVHCFTEVTGCHCSQLLRSYEYSGDPVFRDRAIAVIKAYEKYGWDERAHNYYASIRVDDGSPVVKYDPDRGAPVTKFMPIGYVDLWRTIMYSFEFPLVAAQSSVYAYELSDIGQGTKDPELLTIALHWAEVLEKNLPAHLGRRWKQEVESSMPDVLLTGGTYAENYGRAISFFVHLYRATGDQKHLDMAETIATEAVEKLYTNGIFRGHPAKPYYQSNEGVGFLLYALLELDQPEKEFGGAF